MSEAGEQEQHRLVREQLGSYALGHLPSAGADMVRAHVDGCATCRAELEEIEPLRALLDTVDPARFETPPTPPVGLGDKIRSAIGEERVLRDADELRNRRGAARGRAMMRARMLVAAAAVVLIALGGGAFLGRATAPEPPSVPLEPVALEAVGGSNVDVESADLVAHSWGVELRIVATGFAEGETFRAAFRDEDGTLSPAGEFIGTGRDTMTCNLQSAEVREGLREIVVMDDSGNPVVASRI